MAKKNTYRSFIGFVKYEPRDGTVKRGDEEVAIRSFVIRNVGVKDQAIDVRATLWPSHEHVEIAQGDLVAIEGPFKVNKGEDDDGNPVTYFNLSVANIAPLAAGDFGVRDDRDDEEERPARRRSRSSEDAEASAESDDDIPW